MQEVKDGIVRCTYRFNDTKEWLLLMALARACPPSTWTFRQPKGDQQCRRQVHLLPKVLCYAVCIVAMPTWSHATALDFVHCTAHLVVLKVEECDNIVAVKNLHKSPHTSVCNL